MSLTQGLTLNCNLPNQGGTENSIYLMPCNWLDSPAFVVEADGSLSNIAIDLVASGGVAGFYKYDLESDRNGFVEEVSGTKPNTFILQTVTAVVPKLLQEHRNRIQEWKDCRCGLLAIVVDNNCRQWVLGISYQADCAKFRCTGLRMEPGTTAQTGVDPTADANEYVVSLTANNFEFAREYTGTIPTA